MSTITPQILLKAYAAGIFPMAESADDNALYWVEPEERGIFPLDGLHISHSLRKRVRQRRFDIRIDTAFARGHRGLRRNDAGPQHDLDQPAHPVALRPAVQDGLLPLGRMLARTASWSAAFTASGSAPRSSARACSRASRDASKVALVHLVARLKAGGFSLLDAQFTTPHLESLGARTVGRADYHLLLERAIDQDAEFFRFNADRDPEKVLGLAGRQIP